MWSTHIIDQLCQNIPQSIFRAVRSNLNAKRPGLVVMTILLNHLSQLPVNVTLLIFDPWSLINISEYFLFCQHLDKSRVIKQNIVEQIKIKYYKQSKVTKSRVDRSKEEQNRLKQANSIECGTAVGFESLRQFFYLLSKGRTYVTS